MTAQRIPGALLAACAAVGALAAGGPGAAHAAQPGYYAGLHAGANDVKDWNAAVTLGKTVSLPGSVAAGRGVHWGLFGGWQTENARFEAELQAGEFSLDGIRAGPLSQAVNTEGDYQALMFNAYRVLALTPGFSAYGALGIGIGRVSLPQMGFSGGCNCFPAAKNDGFAWQARMGAEWHIAPQHNAFLQYTSLRLPRPTSGSTPGVAYERKPIGALSVGYRHTF